MEETVHIEINSSNMVKPFQRYQISKSGLCEVSRNAFGGWGHESHDILESILISAHRFWIFPSNIYFNRCL